MIDSMSSSSSTILEVNHNTQTHVQADLPCAECGYNLRTLAYSAKCPECGMAVLVSARGDRLDAAPASWIKRIHRGALWLKGSVVLAFPFFTPGVALSCYAVWNLTATQPDRDEPAMDRSYRLAARWVTILGAMMVVVLTLGALILVAATEQRLFGDWSTQLGSGGGGLMDSLPMFDVMYISGHAIYVLGLLSTWRHLGVLAQRVPNQNLARAWDKLVYAWIGAVVGTVGVSGVTYLMWRIGLVPGWSTSFWMPMILVLAFMAVLVWLWLTTLRVTASQVRVIEVISAGADDE